MPRKLRQRGKRSKIPSPPSKSLVAIPLDETPSFKESIRIGNEFSSSWSKVLHVMIPGSLAYSPVSIRSMVAMGCLAGRGNTADEISKSLLIPSATDESVLALQSFCENEHTVETYLKKFHSPRLNCHFLESRCLCIKRGFEITRSFTKLFEALFPTASFHEVRFGDPNAAAERINALFLKESGNQIRIIVQPRELNEYTRMMLLGGIYFCGNWKIPFVSKSNSIMDFKVNSKNRVQVTMMNQAGKFLYVYFPEIDAEVVAIPYYGESLYLVLILPKCGTSLDKLRMRGFPQPILSSMKETSLSLSIPRFCVETRIGLKSMFDPITADFSGITGYVPGGSGLFVSDVIQVVKFEVNEGSTAPVDEPLKPTSKKVSKSPLRRRAALKQEQEQRGTRTASPGGAKSLKQFVVDHPFIFQVVDKKTKTLVIDGTCMDPSTV